MRHISKLMMLFAALVLGFSACQKVDDLPFYEEGNAVLLSANKATVTPAAGDSLSAVVSFSWTDPNYATDPANYKFVLELDSAGRNFTKAYTRTVEGVNTLDITGKELNAVLLNYGFTLGQPYEMDVRVFSSYSNNNERYASNTVRISVTPYNDPSVLASDVSSVSLSLANASQRALTFSWSPSFNGYSGDVSYVLQYDLGGAGFANPKEIALGTNLFSRDMTQEEINNSAIDAGITMGDAGTVDYRVKAVTTQGAVSYSNTLTINVQSYVSILRFYLPGGYQAATGNGNDWSPETAPELIRDLRPGLLNNMYYIYIWLPGGAEFKVTQGRSWDVNYGGSGGDLVAGGANFTVASSGYYRVTIDRNTMKYDIREGRMGFVGGATGAGWDPPSVFPNYRMGLAANNLFVGLTDLNTDQWKLIDNNEWNNGSNSVTETRSYGTGNGSGSTLQVNGDNFAAPGASGRYRVIWDGRNVDDVKYEMSPATEMRLVGDGIDQAGVNDWSPETSPQMNYQGFGVWTLTINLKAGKDIKFLAGNAWGAFDYEDRSGGNNATGVTRGIGWDGGDNFKTPAVAGTYTITLNEYTQTMRID